MSLFGLCTPSYITHKTEPGPAEVLRKHLEEGRGGVGGGAGRSRAGRRRSALGEVVLGCPGHPQAPPSEACPFCRGLVPAQMRARPSEPRSAHRLELMTLVATLGELREEKSRARGGVARPFFVAGLGQRVHLGTESCGPRTEDTGSIRPHCHHHCGWRLQKTNSARLVGSLD